jgi:hypothetical protein
VSRPRRALFVLTILTGSFLLFLIQPMIARMALPRLGGTPAVWNSAMLVYQALLLAGYAYAHHLSRLPLRRQAAVHLTLFALAALTLPVGLISLPAPAAGAEVLWVPLLLMLSIGPVFLLVSAQAPLLQRWFAADPNAGEPWALYSASNLGSFGGLIAYPLLAEPLLSLRQQSLMWSAGYGVLVLLVAACALARRKLPFLVKGGVGVGLVENSSDCLTAPTPTPEGEGRKKVPRRRIFFWLMLAAVPSGLMLSTTTHLTTDLLAMPLLWVIPLGLYLLSFVIAFADRRGLARVISALTWVVVLSAGSLAMDAHHSNGLLSVFAAVGLLFFVCVALHARMYDLRPEAKNLTLFYLTMSAGGALGGLFTALIAPLIFDWSWEHPILVLAAAALLPRRSLPDWRKLPGLDPEMAKLTMGAVLICAGLLAWKISHFAYAEDAQAYRWSATLVVALCGLLLVRPRGLVLGVLLMAMVAQGGFQTIKDSWHGLRSRSYFGIYTVRTYEDSRIRTLTHGSTLHGEQSLDPKLRDMPLSYYGPGSGAGLVFSHAKELFGPHPRVGVVGLGTGTLACFNQPGEDWRIFEIDPAVLEFSRNGTFTFVHDCAPQAKVVIGDARLELAKAAPGSLDLLAVDAFSSDSIPLHLMTEEALATYLKSLSPNGVLLVHISNRFIDLEPVLAAASAKHRLTMALRDDNPAGDTELSASLWVMITRDPAQLQALERLAPTSPWRAPIAPAKRLWTDDHASILPYVRWENLIRTTQ